MNNEQGQRTDPLAQVLGNAMLTHRHPLFGLMRFAAERIHFGSVTLSIPFIPELADSEGALHRAVAGTLADQAGGIASLSRRGKMSPVATLDLRMDYRHDTLMGSGLRAIVYCDFCNDQVAHVSGLVTDAEHPSHEIARITAVFAVDTASTPLPDGNEDNP